MSYDSDNQQNDNLPPGGPERPTPPPGGRPPRLTRSPMFWLALIAGVMLAVMLLSNQQPGEVEQRPAVFLEWLEKDPAMFKTAEIRDGVLHAELRQETDAEIHHFSVQLQSQETVDRYDKLLTEELGPRYKGITKDPWTPWKETLIFLLPWIILGGLMYFLFIRQLRNAGGGGGVLSFGKTRAKLIRKESSRVTFEDVAGMHEAKEDVLEIIEFLKNPNRFRKIGGRMPRGILFMGPPGTGKTLLAKAIAGEADVPFYSISGSDFVEMFVGVGASRVRDLFRQAKQNSPCIIFLDEIDAVGRRRAAQAMTGAHDEREQTLNAILVEMDGFETSDQVIVIAATNRPDVLDPALRRPGRFDREVTISLPDINEREAILKVHAREVRMCGSIDLRAAGRGTPGFSGADLAALINEAALAATMHDKECVTQEDLEEARDKVRWGRMRRSKAMDELDKRVSAYHEAGHALISVMLQPDAEPLHKVTIIPRGPSLGATMFLPEKDRYTIRQKECIAGITVSFGGRVAEELVFEDISSGAAMDIRQATDTARRMVTQWGMSPNLGPIHYAGSEGGENGFYDPFGGRSHSEITAREIDEEVHRIIDQCYGKARDILTAHRNQLETLAEALLAFEVLDAAEVQRILEGKPLSRTKDSQAEPPERDGSGDAQATAAAKEAMEQDDDGPDDDASQLRPPAAT